MAVKIAAKADGKPDMRFACNRKKYLADPTKNIDQSADIRLSINKDKVSTKEEIQRRIKANITPDYFVS